MKPTHRLQVRVAIYVDDITELQDHLKAIWVGISVFCKPKLLTE